MKTCCCLTLKTGALLMTFANFVSPIFVVLRPTEFFQICGTILLLLGFNNTIIYTNLYLHNYYFLLLGSALIAGALALLYGTTKVCSGQHSTPLSYLSVLDQIALDFLVPRLELHLSLHPNNSLDGSLGVLASGLSWY
jgi:hypothetical protein